MKTLRQLIAKKMRQPKSRLLGFREFCEYVYEPSKRFNSMNLSEEAKKEIKQILQDRVNPQD